MITSLTPINLSHGQLMAAANELHQLVNDPGNEDLSLDFQNEHEVFGRSATAAYGELVRSSLMYELGEYEQFLISVQAESDECVPGQLRRTVGIASLCIAEPEFVPEMVNPETPNLSLFICRPFRGQGVGTAVLSQLMESVETSFHGEVWTLIRQANIASQKVVIGAGFTQVGEENGFRGFQTPVNFYAYRSPLIHRC